MTLPATDNAMPRWCADRPTRDRLAAAIEALNGRLLATASATRALEDWCRGGAGSPVDILATAIPDADRPLPPAAALRPGPGESVAHRRVHLTLGDRILSEANNWYLPGLLTSDMNGRLDKTDAPFGKVVAALDFTRETLGVERLWHPRESACAPDGSLLIPPVLFRHRALLRDKSGRAFSEVHESYRRDLLIFVPEAQSA